MATTRLCTIVGCGNPRHGRGWCKKHYECWRINGDPRAPRIRVYKVARYLREVVLAFSGDECLIWPHGRVGGKYGVIKDKGKTRLVHRVVCETVYGPPPTAKHEAAHNCGNSRCVNARHLRWATPVENQADRIAHGTHSRGQRTWTAKLTEDDVRAIHGMRGKRKHREIAAEFGISTHYVSQIFRGVSWAWVDVSKRLDHRPSS